MEAKQKRITEVQSGRSSPQVEAKPQRPNVRPKMKPRLKECSELESPEKSRYNWSRVSSISRYSEVLAEFCPYKLRKKKQEKVKIYKDHILSPEKYVFTIKKFPKIEENR